MDRTRYEEKFLPGIGPGPCTGCCSRSSSSLHRSARSSPAGCCTDRAAPARSFRPHVGWNLRSGQGHRTRLRPHRDSGLHHGRQQVRTRRRHRHPPSASPPAKPSPVGRSSSSRSSSTSSTSPRLAAALLTGGLFHQLTTVRTEDFDEDTATVAFHDPARYADGCATHPIPAWAHHFLRAAACFATLTDVADRQLLACQGDRPQLLRLAESAKPPPTPAPGSSTDRARPRRVGLERTQRSRTLRAPTDCTTLQTGILVRLEPAQRLVTAVSWRRTVSRWRSRRTRHP